MDGRIDAFHSDIAIDIVNGVSYYHRVDEQRYGEDRVRTTVTVEVVVSVDRIS